MRQTTSLTMAYLLEQNARFEAFMRRRVEELETIVTQQQARASSASGSGEVRPAEAEAAWAEEEIYSEVEEVTADDYDFEPADTSSEFAFTSAAQDEIRPVPVMPVVGQFVLDDVVGFESESPAGKDAPPSQAESTTLPSSLDPVVGGLATGGSGREPAEPPDWQAMLLGTPAGSDEGTELSEPDEISDEEKSETQETPLVGEQIVDLAEETDRVEPDEFYGAGEMEEAVQEQASGPDLVPDWLRRQQEAMLARESPESSAQQQAQRETRPALPDDHVEAVRAEQAVLPAEVVGDDAAWDTSLEVTGPVEQWA
jgi:hypothetical protein